MTERELLDLELANLAAQCAGGGQVQAMAETLAVTLSVLTISSASLQGTPGETGP